MKPSTTFAVLMVHVSLLVMWTAGINIIGLAVLTLAPLTLMIAMGWIGNKSSSKRPSDHDIQRYTWRG